MALEVFQGASIPRELSSGAMEFLWAKWKTLTATKGLTLQRLTEESSYDFRDRLILLMPVGDDFVPIYVGRGAQQTIGSNPTGRPLSASKYAVGRELLELYRHAAKHFAPSFVRLTAPRARGEIWQGLALPVRIADGMVMMVVYTEHVSPHREVYEYLFQSSPDAMVVASPIANETGDALDGWVVMMNGAARELLDFKAGVGNLRLKHLPHLADVDFSFRLHPPVTPGTYVRTAPGPGFEIDVIRFAQVFALVLRPSGLARRLATPAPALAPA